MTTAAQELPNQAGRQQPDLQPDGPSRVTAAEGIGVVHLFFSFRIDAPELTRGDTDVKNFAACLARWQERMQVHAYAGIGHKADVIIWALDADFVSLRAMQSELATAARPLGLELTWSYTALTERGEYMPTEATERARLAELEIDTDEVERRVEEFNKRIAKYASHKLTPTMPPWDVFCFYPMSHRREGDDNWYSLDFDERSRLMHDHGKTGRGYTGRVLQLVAGSTGLDDWEWGVTLIAHDIADIKDAVYTMRYDEASARYAEFGRFIIGYRRSPEHLFDELLPESLHAETL